ncbi:hypothetical protein JCM4914_63380 [Streptomyces platensis subsp. malvinus]
MPPETAGRAARAPCGGRHHGFPGTSLPNGETDVQALVGAALSPGGADGTAEGGGRGDPEGEPAGGSSGAPEGTSRLSRELRHFAR